MTRDDETPEQTAQRERWAEKERAERARWDEIERERKERRDEQARRAVEDARLEPLRRRFAELVGDERRLVAVVEAPLDLFTDYRERARAEAELAWLRRVMDTCPEEAKPARAPKPEALRAQRADRRAALEAEIRDLEEELRQSEELSRSPKGGPPVDSRTGPALEQWRRNQTAREEGAERHRSMLKAELDGKRRALRELVDE